MVQKSGKLTIWGNGSWNIPIILVNQGFTHPIGTGMSEPSTVFSDVYRSWIYFKPPGEPLAEDSEMALQNDGNLRISRENKCSNTETKLEKSGFSGRNLSWF